MTMILVISVNLFLQIRTSLHVVCPGAQTSERAKFPKALTESHVYSPFDDLMPIEGIFVSATDFQSVLMSWLKIQRTGSIRDRILLSEKARSNIVSRIFLGEQLASQNF